MTVPSKPIVSLSPSPQRCTGCNLTAIAFSSHSWVGIAPDLHFSNPTSYLPKFSAVGMRISDK